MCHCDNGGMWYYYVAVSVGCSVFTQAQKYFKMFQRRVGKIAFTDSAHSLGGGFYGPSKAVCNLLVTVSVLTQAHTGITADCGSGVKFPKTPASYSYTDEG